MHVLESCPLGEPLIAAPEHPDLAVAPWLFADPIDCPIGVPRFNLPRPNLIWATGFAACIHHHSHVAMHGGLPRPVHGVQTGVDGEIERCRLPSSDVLLADDQGTEGGAVFGLYLYITLNHVAQRVVFPYQRIGERDQGAIFHVELVATEQG